MPKIDKPQEKFDDGGLPAGIVETRRTIVVWNVRVKAMLQEQGD